MFDNISIFNKNVFSKNVFKIIIYQVLFLENTTSDFFFLFIIQFFFKNTFYNRNIFLKLFSIILLSEVIGETILRNHSF